EGDVGAQRIAGDERPLRDVTDAALPVTRIARRRPVAVDPDAALGGLQEPDEQVDERALAGRRTADDSVGASAPEVDRHVFQRPLRRAGRAIADRLAPNRTPVGDGLATT